MFHFAPNPCWIQNKYENLCKLTRPLNLRPVDLWRKCLRLSSSQEQRQFSQHSWQCHGFLCLLLRAGLRSQRHHKCHSIFDGPSCGSMPICSIPPSSQLTPIYLSIHSFNHLSILPHSPSLPPPSSSSFPFIFVHLYPFLLRHLSSQSQLLPSLQPPAVHGESLWYLSPAFVVILKQI